MTIILANLGIKDCISKPKIAFWPTAALLFLLLLAPDCRLANQICPSQRSTTEQPELGGFVKFINQMSRGRNTVVATGLILFAAAGLAFPFYMATSSKKQPVIDSSKALPPQATFRGPYVNTGSQDIGPDHQTYSKK